MTSELLLNVKRTEDSLLKLNAYRKSSAPSPGGGMTDDNKIRLQIALDVEHYSTHVSFLFISSVHLLLYLPIPILGILTLPIMFKNILWIRSTFSQIRLLYNLPIGTVRMCVYRCHWCV